MAAVSSSVPGGDVPRMLHWVFKVGDLEETLRFYEQVLRLGVLRHEEFEKGCEATCNGPYAGSWSKTMISPKHTVESQHFALELTYNYGVEQYRRGNDLRYIAVVDDGARDRAKANNWKVTENEPFPGVFAHSPDGYLYKLVPPNTFPHATDPLEPFLYVSLHVKSLERALDYWHNLLGMKVYQRDNNSAILGYGDDQCKLELVQLPADQEIDRAEAFGRVAFMTSDVVSKYNAAVSTNDKVVNTPIKLDTPGKATVEVTILQDRDGTEICFVGDVGFVDLSTAKPGDEKVDLEFRRNKLTVMRKYAEKMAARAAKAEEAKQKE